jgi:GLPGLI family protein
MKNIFIAILLLSFSVTKAQQTFVSYGKIEFEKKVNLHKEIEGDTWLENIKDKIPLFKTSYFNLYFKEDKTLFEKGKEVDEKIPFFGDDKSDDNIIYTDLQQQTFAKKQYVFEETYLLSDSIRKVDWKITTDTRDIAGFECHKAVGKILDSVYVIAFYTDQITVSGGPMSFCNLPGMILGIAIPRNNMTIFATKLELIEPKPDKILPPKGKLKKIDYVSLQTTLQKSIKDWGSYGRKYIINFML